MGERQGRDQKGTMYHDDDDDDGDGYATGKPKIPELATFKDKKRLEIQSWCPLLKKVN